MDIKKRIEEIYTDLVSIRRDFHMHPELGMEEFRTSKKIAQYLEEMGIEYKQIANTGIVGVIKGKNSGKTVGLRADIDALPIQEENDVEYKSVYDGKMHACGHDAHTTILLGTARILNEMKDEINGNIKLFFQPAEETVGGAKPMVQEGCMNNPKVDYVIGLHVMSYLETGMIELKYGKMNASSDEIKIKIKGKSGHGAYPEKAVDAIMISGHVLTALQTIVNRNISPTNSLVISIGVINGGTKGNIIADEVVMRGTLRAIDKETRKYAKERIKNIVENISLSFGGKGEVKFYEGYAPLVNDNDIVDVIHKVAEEQLGSSKIVHKENPSLGVEDFSYFLEKAKGSFYHIGCGNKEKGIIESGHNCKFDIDEECLKIGTLMQVGITLELLREIGDGLV